MTAISATEVRSNFSEILGRVAYGKERVTIERRGRPLAVLLPIEDLARLEAGVGGGPAGASNILRAVADNIPGTIYQRVQYPDGREEYSYVSPGIRDTFGIEPEAMISDPATLGRAIHPEDRERRARAIAESARALSPYDVQYRVRTPAGETKWLHAIARPERRADGAIAWTGLTLDITKWKETEAALGESEALLRQAAEMSNLGYWVWDEVEDRCLSCSEILARMYGVSVEEYIEKYRTKEALLADVHPDDRDRYEQTIAAATEQAQAYDIEFRDAAPDGGYRYVRERSEPILDSNGKLVRSVGTLQDITEYKRSEAALERARDELERRVEERTQELHATNRALEEEVGTRKEVEERLRESERDLRNLIEGSVQGVLIVTKDRAPRFANQASAEIFGYDSPAEILALENTLPLIAPYEVARLDELRKPHFADEKAPISYEFDGIRKDGATIRLQCMAQAMTWRGEPVAQVTLYDITERKRAERTLRESEERLSSFINNIPNSIYLKDMEGRYVLINDSVMKQYELPKNRLIGKTVYDLHPKGEADATVKQDREVLKRGVPIEVERELTFPDGSKHNIIAVKFPVRGASGEIMGIGGINIDITERKRVEEALRESEARYRELFDESPVAIWVEDWSPIKRMLDDLARAGVEDWRGYFDSHRDQLRTAYNLAEFLDISRATVELYRKESKEHMLRMTTAATVIDEELDAFREMILSFLAGQMTFEIESKDMSGDGSEIMVRRRVVIPPRYRDDWSRVIYAIEDITERRKAEETVRTRDAWLRAILENAPIQIVLQDTEERIMAISRSAGEMLGVTVDELVGRTTADFLPKQVAEVYMATDREVVETGRSIQQEVVEDWDGTTRHFLKSKFPLRDDSGQIVGVCSLTSDITEAKLAEDRLRQAQKMEAVGQLTGGVAHDFNNLLAVILGNAELLGERLGMEDRQVAAVMRAAGRGAELTQRLLAFSRRQPLKPQAIDLAGQVAGMTELLTRTLGATIEISVASTPGLWRASADPGQLENALLNLAINARDAMPEGGRLSISSANASLEAGEIAALLADQAPEAALEAATGEPGNPGGYVVLAVSDTGTGMSPAVLARVFEPFFTTKDVGQGSGLGLSMVYGFARQSGGFVAIESALGRGTTVRLYLPRAVAAARAPGPRNRAGQLPRGHDETVLLIEDTGDVRELAVALLEDLGYRVLAAADAAEAGALLAENPGVDLLLADVILPGGHSGPDFAETARRHNPALKVLFMSGYPAEVLMERGDSLSRDTPLLPKPFLKAALAKAVREALDDGEEVQGAE